jgi:hypothetical protein
VVALYVALFPWATTRAAEYQQKHGPAVLRLQADKVDGERVEVSISNLHIGLTVSVEGGPELEVRKIASLTASKHWEVKSVEEPKVAPRPGGGKHWEQTFRLEPTVHGDQPLLVSQLQYREGTEPREWNTVVWKPIAVRVTTIVPNPDHPDPKSARDITPPEELPPASRIWYHVFLGAGLALVCLGLLLGGWQLKRRFTSQAAPLPPHQWAVKELDRLQAQRLPEAGQAERYHTLLSDLVRRYLELRFELHAPRQTTAEFLDSMRQAPQLTPAQQALLRDFLERCDLAKFARAEYSVRECQAAADMARAFVEQTASAERA